MSSNDGQFTSEPEWEVEDDGRCPGCGNKLPWHRAGCRESGKVGV